KSSTKAKDEKGANTPNTAQQIPAKPEHAMTIVGASCQDYSWIKKGAILAYEALDKKEKVTGELKMGVKDLNNNESQTIAQIEATMSSSHFEDMTYPMNYICEGDKIYMDIASMMKAMMEKNPTMKNQAVMDAFNNMEIDFNDGFASFPKTMYPGMVLDDLRFSFKTNVGSSEMSFNTHVTDRNVMAREKVTTNAVTFEARRSLSDGSTAAAVMSGRPRSAVTTRSSPTASSIWMAKQKADSGQ